MDRRPLRSPEYSRKRFFTGGIPLETLERLHPNTLELLSRLPKAPIAGFSLFQEFRDRNVGPYILYVRVLITSGTSNRSLLLSLTSD